MVPYGAIPVNPSGPNQPNWIPVDDPKVQQNQYSQGPKHGAINVVVQSNEFNEVPITLLAGNIGFQQATPERPLLPPMQLLRSSLAETRIPSSLPEEIYEELIRRLPPRLQKKLKRQKRQALEDRQPHWAAFDQSLQFMAGMLALLRNLGNGERKKEGLPDHEEFLAQWVEALEEQGNAYLSQAEEALTYLDPGHPERDFLSQLLTEIGASAKQLHEMEKKGSA